MQRYVLGFIFNSSKTLIGLDLKKNPDWQANKLNGFGGKLLRGENAKTVMVDKFLKETNFQTNEDDWILFADILGINFGIDCFYAINNEFFKDMTSNLGSERSVIVPINDLYTCYNFNSYVPHVLTLINHALECIYSGKDQSTIPLMSIAVGL